MSYNAKRKSEYSERLRDPRWQKKRLEIMQRDKFTCQWCSDTKAPLNVHHCYYENNNNPWEYPDASLLTLCENCHAAETNFGWDWKQAFLKALAKRGTPALALMLLFFDIQKNSWKIDIGDDLSVLRWLLSDQNAMKEIFKEHSKKIMEVVDSNDRERADKFSEAAE